jgi:putative hemin transport protein
MEALNDLDAANAVKDAESRDPRALRSAFAAALAGPKRPRVRDLAASLGVREGELIASRVGHGATALVLDVPGLLGGLFAVGRVMALTRNESCVHERKGRYLGYEGSPHVGLVVGPDIDLRIFPSRFGSAFALDGSESESGRKSLQFFGKDGDAVHKVYLTPDSDVAAFDALVAAKRAPEQRDFLPVAAKPSRKPERADDEIDVAALRAGWAKLQDTHDFHGLLAKLGVGREQALRLGGEYATRVKSSSVRRVLEAAAADHVAIMVFVGSDGVIQIHTGEVETIREMGPWINVLDPDFNLHLRQDRIANAYVVAKPTRDGVVTSLEAFDADGELIAQFFGKRKPGIPELESWRAILAAVEREPGKES